MPIVRILEKTDHVISLLHWFLGNYDPEIYSPGFGVSMFIEYKI